LTLSKDQFEKMMSKVADHVGERWICKIGLCEGQNRDILYDQFIWWVGFERAWLHVRRTHLSILHAFEDNLLDCDESFARGMLTGQWQVSSRDHLEKEHLS